MRPSPTHSDTPKRAPSLPVIALVAAGMVGMSGLICVAQQQSPTADADKGQARLVERTGPEVDVAANGQGGQVVVLFPQAIGGDGGEVELTLVESQVAAPVEGQPTPQPAATGRELLFSSRDAKEGVVRHALEASGNGRKFKVLARVNGAYVQAQQTGGSEGVTVMTVKRPEQPAPQPDANAQPNAAAQPAQPAVRAPAAVIVIYAGGNAQ